MKKMYVTPEMEIDLFEDKVSLMTSVSTTNTVLTEQGPDSEENFTLDAFVSAQEGSFSGALNPTADGPALDASFAGAVAEESGTLGAPEGMAGADSAANNAVTDMGQPEVDDVVADETVVGEPDLGGAEAEVPGVEDVVGDPVVDGADSDGLVVDDDAGVEPSVDDLGTDVVPEGDYMPEAETEMTTEPFADAAEPVIEGQDGEI